MSEIPKPDYQVPTGYHGFCHWTEEPWTNKRKLFRSLGESLGFVSSIDKSGCVCKRVSAFYCIAVEVALMLYYQYLQEAKPYSNAVTQV